MGSTLRYPAKKLQSVDTAKRHKQKPHARPEVRSAHPQRSCLSSYNNACRKDAFERASHLEYPANEAVGTGYVRCRTECPAGEVSNLREQNRRGFAALAQA